MKIGTPDPRAGQVIAARGVDSIDLTVCIYAYSRFIVISPMTIPKFSLAAIVTSALICIHPSAFAADAGFAIEKTANGGVTVKVNGQLFAEYFVDQANKPYLAPVFGPTGKQMTRNFPMKVIEGEQHDHPHHRGICFGNEGMAGVDTWMEPSSLKDSEAKKPGSTSARAKTIGFIKHREYKDLKADAKEAVIAAVGDITDVDGKKLLEEEHRITFRADADTRTIDFDLDYIASEGPITIKDAKDAGFSIRVPSSMAVDTKQGGKLVNSEGLTDAATWGKRAKWCDYYGPVEGETLGVAMLNHPGSFRHPTPWHVRTYGLFTANPFGMHSLDKTLADGTFELKKGERVKLRHRLIFHKGDEKAAKIAEAFEAYAKETK